VTTTISRDTPRLHGQQYGERLRTGITAERLGGQTNDTLEIENYVSVFENNGPKFVVDVEGVFVVGYHGATNPHQYGKSIDACRRQDIRHCIRT
jgi:alkyl hydroperoxide reductase subunit AhpF